MCSKALEVQSVCVHISADLRGHLVLKVHTGMGMSLTRTAQVTDGDKVCSQLGHWIGMGRLRMGESHMGHVVG